MILPQRGFHTFPMIFLSLAWPQKRPHRDPARKSGKTSLTFYGGAVGWVLLPGLRGNASGIRKKNCEIPFAKHGYVYQPLRYMGIVSNDLSCLEAENLRRMKELGID
jgi:hypothetical protein